MAFTVEDGTGLAAANSYIARAFADTYHEDRGNTSWADASDKDQESALIQATDYIDQTYRFRGDPATTTQRLRWPRENVRTLEEFTAVASDAVPLQVEEATAEAALSALTQDLVPDGAASSARILVEKAGTIMTRTERSGHMPAFHKVRNILYDLLAPTSLLRG